MKNYSINTDTIFLQGSDHQVCEDYATNFGSVEGSNRIILCDGCSGSPMTDVGARLLALEASQSISQDFENTQDILNLNKWLIQNRHNNLLEINPFIFDATLLFAYENKDTIHTLMYGDGCKIIKYKDIDLIDIYDLEYEKGYPNYFSYRLDENRRLEYLQLNEKLFETHYTLTRDSIKYHKIATRKDYLHESYYIEDIDWILLLSDGLHSFYKINEQGKREYIDFLEIIEKLIDFKNYHGIFVQRQVKHMIKQLKKENIFHYDDFSVAGMYMKEEEKNVTSA